MSILSFIRLSTWAGFVNYRLKTNPVFVMYTRRKERGERERRRRGERERRRRGERRNRRRRRKREEEEKEEEEEGKLSL